MVPCPRPPAIARVTLGAHSLRSDVVPDMTAGDVVAAVREPAVAIELQLVARHVEANGARMAMCRLAIVEDVLEFGRRPLGRHRVNALAGELHRGFVGAQLSLGYEHLNAPGQQPAAAGAIAA